MTWPPHTPYPVPMNLRDPVTPGSAIPVEVAFTMRKTPRDEMTTGEAEAYARGRAEAMAWRPIETAPRDGMLILLCVAGYEPAAGIWLSDDGRIGRWVPFDPECVFDNDEQWDSWQSQNSYQPTHWMPLPEPPPPPETRARAC